jgi:hypothetical protein
MYGSVVAMLNIVNTLIPGKGVLGIVDAQYVHDHPIDDLGLAIRLGGKGSGLSEIGV